MLRTTNTKPSTTVAAVALGSNLPSRFGSPADNLREAILRLGALGTVLAVSKFLITDPVGYLHQPLFTNAAALLETRLEPFDLLRGLLQIELAMGRDRVGVPQKGPRLIDLDLLLFGDATLSTPALTLPHPTMQERAFVLQPLAEIAPAMLHPTLHRTIAELAAMLSR